MVRRSIRRRDVLKGAAAAVAAPYVVPSSVLGAAGQAAPSDRAVLGCIGVGGRGSYNMRGLMTQGAQVVAVCDVNQPSAARAKQAVEQHYARTLRKGGYKGCAAYHDFRKLLARDDLDAVMIATPDQWHVPIAIAAVKAGKDVYVEKPLGMTIAEGQALRSAVGRYGAVFMHGTEQRCFRQFRFACELVRNGYLGRLTQIKVACPGGRRIGPQPPMPVPKGFDYDLWLGPARWAPYTRARCWGTWYFISDYATSGFVAGWGIHHIDMAQWGLGTDDTGPVEIVGRGVLPEDGLFDTPVTWNIDYTYAGGERVNFTDNGQNRQGVRYEGTEGWIHVTRGSIEAHPKSLLTVKLGPNETRLYEAKNDDRNFVECVRSRRETASPIEVAHRSTSVCYLGHIAILLGRKLRWDHATERFVNDAEADRYLSRPLREPWRL